MFISLFAFFISSQHFPIWDFSLMYFVILMCYWHICFEVKNKQTNKTSNLVARHDKNEVFFPQ